LASLGHTTKFQPVSRFRFVTAATSLNGGQLNLSQCLAISWAGTVHINLQGLLPLTEFCQLQNSLCVQVLRSPLLAALLHGTQAAGVSQFAAWCKEWNYGTFADILGRAAITSGIGSHSTVLTYRCKIVFTFFYPGHVFNVFLNSYNLFYFKLRSENDIYILHNNRLQYFCYAIIRLINGIGLLIYYCGTRIISVCQVSSA